MFSETFYSYFKQLFRECKEDEAFDENHFFYKLKARFPETCQKYDGLQALFLDIIREKWPDVFIFFGFTLRKCAACKLNHIVKSRTGNFFISGGGEWVYEFVDNAEYEEDRTFACYTYGSRFDYESVDVSKDDYKAGNLFYDNFQTMRPNSSEESMDIKQEGVFFCDKCLFQHHKEGKINFDSEFSETVCDAMAKGTHLFEKYDFKHYEALTSEINNNEGKNLTLYY